MSDFEYLKTIGIVCDDVPFVLNTKGSETFLVTSIDRSFVIYECGKLTKVVHSQPLEQRITNLAVKEDINVVACGSTIYGFHRIEKIWEVTGHTSKKRGRTTQSKIASMIIVANILISIDTTGWLACYSISDGTCLSEFHLHPVGLKTKRSQSKARKRAQKTAELVVALPMAGSTEYRFIPALLFHPRSYANQVLVTNQASNPASGHNEDLVGETKYPDDDAEPSLFGFELWNVDSQKLVRRYEGWSAPITCMEQSPVVGVVGIGLQDGRIMLFDLEKARSLVSFSHTGASPHGSQGTQSVSVNSVTSISFRTDGGTAEKRASDRSACMVTSASNGEIVIWDVTAKSRAHILRQAHSRHIVCCAFVPDEPLLISAGKDNKLKMYIFDDENEFIPRCLKSREGHFITPHRIRFYGKTILNSFNLSNEGFCNHILSASKDRTFRRFNLFSEQQNMEMSQHIIVKDAKRKSSYVEKCDLRLHEMVDFDFIETRERDWANVASIHKEDGAVYTWNYRNRSINKFSLRPDQGRHHSLSGLRTAKIGNLKDNLSNYSTGILQRFGAPSSVCISSCGNFCVVGTAKGILFRYSLQSGRLIGHYPSTLPFKKLSEFQGRRKKKSLDPSHVKLITDTANNSEKAEFSMETMHLFSSELDYGKVAMHTDTVTGICVDQLNDYLVSASKDGSLRFWHFRTGRMLQALPLSHSKGKQSGSRKLSILQLRFHKDSGSIALSCDDLTVKLVNVYTRVILRTIQCDGPLNDYCFSFCGKFLYTAECQGGIKVCDIVGGRVLSKLFTESPCLSLAISMSGNYLCTTDKGSVGIQVWRSLRQGNEIEIDSYNNQDLFVASSSKASSLLCLPEESSEEEADAVEDRLAKLEEACRQQRDTVRVAGSMSEFSGKPQSKWLNLAILETIKKRNKPIKPAEKPKSAPFFLPATKAAPKGLFERSGEAPRAEESGQSGAVDELPQSGDFSDFPDEDEMEITNEAPHENSPVEESKINSRVLANGGDLFLTRRSKIMEVFSLVFSDTLRVLGTKASSRSPKQASPDEGVIHALDLDKVREKAVHIKELFQKASEPLLGLSASGVDYEIQNLCIDGTDSSGKQSLQHVLLWIYVEICCKLNLEVIEAILGRVLYFHGQIIEEDGGELASMLHRIKLLQEAQWADLNGLLQHNLCLLSFLTMQN